MNLSKEKVRVMIVDDSSFARDIIATILSTDPEIEVVGTAIDGQDALDKIMVYQPNLITMDIVMPRMDGLEAIEHVMAFNPTPILCVTSQQDAHIAFQALSKGALEVVEKPTFENMGNSQSQKEFISKVKLLAKVKVITHVSGRKIKKEETAPLIVPTVVASRAGVNKVVAVASSTGGPKVLAKILGALPNNFGGAVLIVQHIADGFAKSLVDWLNGVSPLTVKVAQAGEKIAPGVAFIAPTGFHMEVTKDGAINLTKGPEEEGQRPAANVMMRSVAESYGRNALGVVLTGMGRDGGAGLLAIKRKSGATLAQNQESCVVFGMPKTAIDMGVVDKVLSIEAIIDEIVRFAK